MLDPNSIPPIGSSNTVNPQQKQKADPQKLFSIAPNEVTLASFFGKVIIGAITG